MSSTKEYLLQLQQSQARTNAELFLLEGYLGIYAAAGEYDKKFGLVRDASGQFAKKAGSALDRAEEAAIDRSAARQDRAKAEKKIPPTLSAKDGADEAASKKSIKSRASEALASIKKTMGNVIGQMADDAIVRTAQFVNSKAFENGAKKVGNGIDAIDKGIGDAFDAVQKAYTSRVSEENRKTIAEKAGAAKTAIANSPETARRSLLAGMANAAGTAERIVNGANSTSEQAVGATLGMVATMQSMYEGVKTSSEPARARVRAQIENAMDQVNTAIAKVTNPAEYKRLVDARAVLQDHLDQAEEAAKTEAKPPTASRAAGTSDLPTNS